MILPDYSNNIANIISSIKEYFGVSQNKYTSNKILDTYLHNKKPKIVITILVDGLGYNYIKNNPKSFLASKLEGFFTSTFPSTTTVAHTCRVTGETAQNHGLSSRYFYLREIDRQIISLKFTTRLDQVGVETLIDPLKIFPNLSQCCPTH